VCAIFLQVKPAGAHNQRNLIHFVPNGSRYRPASLQSCEGAQFGHCAHPRAEDLKASLQGRAFEEPLPGGVSPTVENWVDRGASQMRYFDAAGFPGRTVRLDGRKTTSR
jgi:hypothetical protein